MVSVVDEPLLLEEESEETKKDSTEFIRVVKNDTKPLISSISDAKPTKDKKGKTVDYTVAISELLHIPAGVLASVGAVTKNENYSCDAVAIMLYTPTIAEAVNSVAQEDERIANVLDKILKTGPYAALVGALVPLAMQIATNHNKLPPVASMGILSKEDLMAKVATQSE